MKNFIDSQAQLIIQEGIKNGITQACVDFADKFGKHLCALDDRGRPSRDALTTNQIRNFFSEIKRIQQSKITNQGEQSAFLLIRPKLAYAEARTLERSFKSRIKDFRAVVELAHRAVDIKQTDTNKMEQEFNNFVDFLEANLAYHKSYGGSRV